MHSGSCLHKQSNSNEEPPFRSGSSGCWAEMWASSQEHKEVDLFFPLENNDHRSRKQSRNHEITITKNSIKTRPFLPRWPRRNLFRLCPPSLILLLLSLFHSPFLHLGRGGTSAGFQDGNPLGAGLRIER